MQMTKIMSMNAGVDAPGTKQYSLTNIGFHYVLLDTPTQVHTILRKYMEYKQKMCPRVTTELIKIIFNFALSEYNKSYKMRSNDGDIAKIVRDDFAQLGLVEFTQSDPNKFYITKFMQSFLLTQIGDIGGSGGEQASNANQVQLPENSLSSNEKFIIVETNFRVFAYTTNKLYKEILKLFLEPKKEFQNMFYGVLMKSHVEEAFKQQITANQIMNFLVSHAHPDAIYAAANSKKSATSASTLAADFGQMNINDSKAVNECD